MRSQGARRKVTATEARNLRTLLLLNVFEPEEIGDRIQQARLQAGLRQEDLAVLIGMSTRQVQSYEAGASKQYGKLRAIAGATDSSVEWLLHGETAASSGTTSPALEELRDDALTRHQEIADRLAAIETRLRLIALTVGAETDV